MANQSVVLICAVLSPDICRLVIAVLAGFGTQALVGVRTGNKVFRHFGVGISLIDAVLIILASALSRPRVTSLLLHKPRVGTASSGRRRSFVHASPCS